MVLEKMGSMGASPIATSTAENSVDNDRIFLDDMKTDTLSDMQLKNSLG